MEEDKEVVVCLNGQGGCLRAQPKHSCWFPPSPDGSATVTKELYGILLRLSLVLQ